jgi:hypothetical protein
MCVQNARATLGLERVATSRINKVGKNYTIAVRLYRGNKIYGSGSGRCDICTLTEAVNTMIRLAEELGTRGEEPPDVAARPKPKPVPVVPPRPAPVAQPKPATPRPAPVAQPKPGPAPGVQPKPNPVPAVRRVDQNPWPLWPALVAGGAGIVGLSVGIPLLVMDGKGADCRGEARPDKTNCTKLYKTAAGGWIATGIGIGALAASGVLFYMYWSTRPDDQPTARVEQILFGPAPSGGFVLGAAGRF